MRSRDGFSWLWWLLHRAGPWPLLGAQLAPPGITGRIKRSMTSDRLAVRHIDKDGHA